MALYYCFSRHNRHANLVGFTKTMFCLENQDNMGFTERKKKEGEYGLTNKVVALRKNAPTHEQPLALDTKHNQDFLSFITVRILLSVVSLVTT